MLQLILEADRNILLFIQEFLRFEWLNPIVIFFTHLGDGGAVWILSAALLLIKKQYRKTGILAATALLIGFLVTNLLLKNLIMRPRPYDAVLELHALVMERGWSFPSGHSTSSMAAGTVMFLRMPHTTGIPILILAIIICLSRLYVGVHYPTDVICGALVGMFAAVCALQIVERREKKLGLS